MLLFCPSLILFSCYSRESIQLNSPEGARELLTISKERNALFGESHFDVSQFLNVQSVMTVSYVS
jgi:hypothetical protein